jgi:plasmid maintenance system antidote protein VapI
VTDGEEQVQGRTPAELLKATLRTLKMNQAGLCRRTGLSTKHINQVAQGHIGVTPDLALLLERATGTPATAWMTAELNRRRIQGGQVATREQINLALAHALREAPWDGESNTNVSVAWVAMEHLLGQLGIPIWDGVLPSE